MRRPSKCKADSPTSRLSAGICSGSRPIRPGCSQLLSAVDLFHLLDLFDLLRLARPLDGVDLRGPVDLAGLPRLVGPFHTQRLIGLLDAALYFTEARVAERLCDGAPTHTFVLAHGEDLVHRPRPRTALLCRHRQQDGEVAVPETLVPVLLHVLRGQLTGRGAVRERELCPLPLIDELCRDAPLVRAACRPVHLLPGSDELPLALRILGPHGTGHQDQREDDHRPSHRRVLLRSVPLRSWRYDTLI